MESINETFGKYGVCPICNNPLRPGETVVKDEDGERMHLICQMDDDVQMLMVRDME